jgi:hypothetical protein
MRFNIDKAAPHWVKLVRMSDIVLKPFDAVAVVLALGATVMSAVLTYGGADSRAMAKISGGGSDKDAWVFYLDGGPASVRVPGPLGDTVVVVRDGSAWIAASPCANQVCVAAGALRRPGQWAACLPNQTVLLIEGGPESGDAADIVVW